MAFFCSFILNCKKYICRLQKPHLGLQTHNKKQNQTNIKEVTLMFKINHIVSKATYNQKNCVFILASTKTMS